MATPIGDTYSCASGGSIYAGRYFVDPFWTGLSSGWHELTIPGNKPGNGLVAYSGMALDESTGDLFLVGGGHQDAPNDEPWRLNIDTRAGWVQEYPNYFGQNPPLASAQAVTDNVNYPGAIVLGGVPVKPISRHTYRTIHWIDSIKRVVVGGGSTYSGTGSDYLWYGQPGGGAWLNAPGDWWEYNPVTKTWQYDGSETLNPAYHAGAGDMKYHVGRDKLFSTTTNGNNSLNMRVWDPVANTWVIRSGFAAGNTSIGYATVVDSTRDRLVVLSERTDSSVEVYAYNIDADTWSLLPSSGSIPTTLGYDYNAVYSPESDKIYLISNSTNGFKIYNVATGAWTTQSINGSVTNLLQTCGRFIYDKRRKVMILVYADSAAGIRVFAYKE